MNKIIAVILMVVVYLANSCSSDTAVSGSGESMSDKSGVSGQAGSMARFALVSDFLYTLDKSNMSIYWVDKPENPTFYNSIGIDWGVETLFPYGENLFIGAEGGMFIYDISSPANPKFLSEFSHVRSCDPVVVQDTIAYVTLRSGSSCWSDANRLEIINVSNIDKPTLIAVYDMTNPHGLAIKDSLLYVCDGKAGIKCFNVKDPEDIQLVQHFGDIDAYDVILTDTTMIAISEEGLFQYDRRTVPLTLLSKITISE